MSEINRVLTLIHRVMTAERSHSANMTFSDEIWPLHTAQTKYSLKLKLHASGPEILELTKLCTEQLTNILGSTWMSSEA